MPTQNAPSGTAGQSGSDATKRRVPPTILRPMSYDIAVSAACRGTPALDEKR
jgi:hypothetical protein